MLHNQPTALIRGDRAARQKGCGFGIVQFDACDIHGQRIIGLSQCTRMRGFPSLSGAVGDFRANRPVLFDPLGSAFAERFRDPVSLSKEP